MSNPLSCLSCNGALPKNIPADEKNVNCEYCGQLNPNPNFVQNTAPLKHVAEVSSEAPATSEPKTKKEKEEVRPIHNINLNESSLTTAFSVATLIAGVGLFIYFWFYQQSMWTYLLTSAVMILPGFMTSFIPARWENVAKKATLESHEKYIVKYETSGVESFLVFVSYVYMVWFTYSFFASFVPVFDSSGGKEVLCGILALILPLAGIWLITSLLDGIASSLGKAFPKA